MSTAAATKLDFAPQHAGAGASYNLQPSPVSATAPLAIGYSNPALAENDNDAPRSSNWFVRGWEGLESTVYGWYESVVAGFASFYPVAAANSAQTTATNTIARGDRAKIIQTVQQQIAAKEEELKLARMGLAKARTEDIAKALELKTRFERERQQLQARLQEEDEKRENAEKEDDDEDPLKKLMEMELFMGAAAVGAAAANAAGNNNTRLTKAGQRAAKIARLEKGAAEGNFLVRNLAKGQLKVLAVQDFAVARLYALHAATTKPLVDFVARPFVAAKDAVVGAAGYVKSGIIKTGDAIKDFFRIGKDVAEAGEQAGFIVKASKALLKVAKSLLKVALPLLRIAKPLMKIAEVIGITAAVLSGPIGWAVLAGVAIGAGAITYLATGSVKDALIETAEFAIPLPVRGIMEMAQGDVRQGLITTADTMIPFVGGAMLNKGISAYNTYERVNMAVSTAQTTAKVAELAIAHPEDAKLIARGARDLATGHTSEAAGIAVAALRADHGDRTNAALSAAMSSSTVRHAVLAQVRTGGFGALPHANDDIQRPASDRAPTSTLRGMRTAAANSPVVSLRTPNNGGGRPPAPQLETVVS